MAGTKKTARKTTTAKKAPAKRSRKMKVTVVPSEAEIRERAYFIYLENGRESGQEEQNWLQAERELMKS